MGKCFKAKIIIIIVLKYLVWEISLLQEVSQHINKPALPNSDMSSKIQVTPMENSRNSKAHQSTGSVSAVKSFLTDFPNLISKLFVSICFAMHL